MDFNTNLLQKTNIKLFCLFLMLLGCNVNEESQKVKLIEPLGTNEIKSDKSSNLTNPLYGKIFRKINEIEEFKNYIDVGGALIQQENQNYSNYKFAIGQYKNADEYICIFEELLKSDEGKVKYKILDTIHILKLKEHEYITYCNCRQDSTWDNEIIAIVNAAEDIEFYDKVSMAWRANTKTGKIEKITNLKGISCMNEGYGLDGCGGDGDYEEADTNLINDSLD